MKIFLKYIQACVCIYIFIYIKELYTVHPHVLCKHTRRTSLIVALWSGLFCIIPSMTQCSWKCGTQVALSVWSHCSHCWEGIHSYIKYQNAQRIHTSVSCSIFLKGLQLCLPKTLWQYIC